MPPSSAVLQLRDMAQRSEAGLRPIPLGVRAHDRAARKRDRSSRKYFSSLGFASVIALIAAYYLFLLSNGTFRLFAAEMLDQVFDNMLLHLLHGRFDVDPQIIGFEAFTKSGKTYAYFGIFPALLRLIAMPFGKIATLEFARISCFAAVVLFVALQLKMVLIVHDSLLAAGRNRLFLIVMLTATALSGPQLYLLGSASIYHESILWSAAMAAAFNMFVVRAACRARALRAGEMIAMALLAGLALNTRPTIGVALYLGLFLLIARRAWRQSSNVRMASTNARTVHGAIAGSVLDPGVSLAVIMLGLLAVGAGVVNFERWGNPFTFADFRYYGWLQHNPSFVRAFDTYGEFSLYRIWIGALYYATGLPYVVRDIPPFAEFLASRVAGIEAPPFSPLITNPLTLVLAGLGIYRLWSSPQLTQDGAAMLRLTLLGHLSAILLVFAAMFFTMRFRFDFAPFMTLAALLGYRSVSTATAGLGEAERRRISMAAVGLCALGVVGSHYLLLVHKVWSIAVPMKVRLALYPFAPFAHAAFGK